MTEHESSVAPALMFQRGVAEEAARFYVSIIKNSRIEEMERYGPEGPGPEGTVKQGLLTLDGRRFLIMDSPITHAFDFTPSISLFVTCDPEEEVERIYGRLSEGGAVLMPLDAYPFSRKFGWVNDRFGVSWQVMLEG